MNLWTIEEHERFLQGLELFHHGPWKAIAAVVGTKTTRQTMTHAQKYRQKIERRKRVAEAIESMASAAHSPFGQSVDLTAVETKSVHYFSDPEDATRLADPPLVGLAHAAQEFSSALDTDPEMHAFFASLEPMETYTASAIALYCSV